MKNKKTAGFTLIELMIVLAIAGLALTFALPAFQKMIERQQLNTAAADMFHAIQLARSEAVRRNRIVQLAPLDEVDWTQGWRLYVSTAGAGTKAAPGPYRDGDRLISQRAALPAGIRIEDPAGSAPSQIYIAYNGGGHSVSRGRMRKPGTWRLHMGREMRVIVLNAQGRARICNPAQDGEKCNPERSSATETG